MKKLIYIGCFVSLALFEIPYGPLIALINVIIFCISLEIIKEVILTHFSNKMSYIIDNVKLKSTKQVPDINGSLYYQVVFIATMPLLQEDGTPHFVEEFVEIPMVIINKIISEKRNQKIDTLLNETL